MISWASLSLPHETSQIQLGYIGRNHCASVWISSKVSVLKGFVEVFPQQGLGDRRLLNVKNKKTNCSVLLALNVK